ncbi:hypothetical protein BBP40_008251 [Aspergillus hancockii]|nr:hypothetical protein BBP40_008251 [Aspergillus hancockii]
MPARVFPWRWKIHVIESHCCLSRILDEIFRLYEQKRRPRVNEMHRVAERNGDVRKKTGPWQLWLKELATSETLLVYSFFGLDRLGLGQKPLVYDVEEDMY